MPSTHLSLHVHIVFSTKNREQIILPVWRDRLHAYIGGILRTLQAIPDSVGGVEDHIHLLVGIRANHAVADLVREVKSLSSRWIHEELGQTRFAWQEGYGAFTISSSEIAALQEYISKQEEHHRARTFQDEYLDFLARQNIGFDEKYLW
ncbi:MAG: IS200/IS605 family transposase [Verrucomicrobia bacterium]|nr:IS200/IS605 family transposase [Verrucomicrobiota bacterium]